MRTESPSTTASAPAAPSTSPPPPTTASARAAPAATPTQCPKERITPDVTRIEAPGSPISLVTDSAVPEDVLTDLGFFLCIARLDLGDSGPIDAHIFSDDDKFADAYSAAIGGPSDRPTMLIARGVRAETRPGQIWFTPNVLKPGGPSFAETVLHEYFHTVQYSLSERFLRTPGDVPTWLFEGSGLYFGFERADYYGLDSIARFRSSQVRAAKATPEPLSSFEAASGASSSRVYALGFLAAEYLAKKYGTDKVKQDFWVDLAAGEDWRTTFSSTFGVSVEVFYADFEAYRRTL